MIAQADQMEHQTARKTPPSRQPRQRQMTNCTQLHVWYYIKMRHRIPVRSKGCSVLSVVDSKKTIVDRKRFSRCSQLRLKLFISMWGYKGSLRIRMKNQTRHPRVSGNTKLRREAWDFSISRLKQPCTTYA